MKAIRRFLWDMDFMSKLFILLGVILLTPILIILPYPHESESIGSFLYPAIFSILFGSCIVTAPKEGIGRRFSAVLMKAWRWWGSGPMPSSWGPCPSSYRDN